MFDQATAHRLFHESPRVSPADGLRQQVRALRISEIGRLIRAAGEETADADSLSDVAQQPARRPLGSRI